MLSFLKTYKYDKQISTKLLVHNIKSSQTEYPSACKLLSFLNKCSTHNVLDNWYENILISGEEDAMYMFFGTN